MKYIIKNCPATYKKLKINENNELYIDEYRCNHNTFYACQECTDCILKQIVKRCKKVRECTADICTNPYEYATYYETRGVLELLDIQEVE